MLENKRACATGIARCQPASLTESLYCAFHHAPNGQSSQAIADRLGRNWAYWTAAVDVVRKDRPFPADAIAPLLLAAGTVEPLRYLGAELRCGIFPLPSLGGAQTEINLRLLRVLKELGDVSEVLERIQMDGKLDSDEGRLAIEQLRELLEAVVALQAAIAEASREAVMTRPLPARMQLPAAATGTRRRA